jgi:hypothetical protein
MPLKVVHAAPAADALHGTFTARAAAPAAVE